MSNPQMISLTPEQLYAWFNTWIKDGLSDRDKVIIGETIWALNNPGDIKRSYVQA
jgi:hypothetical protein